MKSAIAWFAANPVAANLLMALVLIGGLLSATQLRQETYPNVAFDVVSIGIPYPGAAPDEVERAVCIRVEEAIYGVEGVDRIWSRASEGYAAVWVRLAVGADARRAIEEIRTRVSGIEGLPDETEPPVIQELVDDSVLLAVALHGGADEATLRAAGERMREELTELPQVTRAELVGARAYELAIEVSEHQLRRHGLGFDDVVRAVRASSLDLPGGSLKTIGGEILLRAEGQAYRGEEFERILLLTRDDGTRLHLGEVARVVDGFVETDERVRVDGEPAVVVRLLTSERENVLVIADAVERYLEGAEAWLPDVVSAELAYDQVQGFRSRRSLLLRNGTQGLVLILVVLALFLRLRVAFWVAAGIPVALLGALLTMAAVDVSVNMMSLFAFIVALGLVVDDAIVVGESVARHQRAECDPVAAATAGTLEVAMPVTVAVLTTVFFLLPTVQLPTVIGKISRPLGIVAIACLLFSLVEALFILPAHLARREPAGSGAQGRWARLQGRVERGLERFVEERYRPLVERCLRWPALTLSLGAVTLMLAAALLAGSWVRSSFIPEFEDDYVWARLVMPEGTPPEEMEVALGTLEREALALRDELEAEAGVPIYQHLTLAVGDFPYRHDDFKGGGDGPHVANVQLSLVPAEARHVSSLDVERRWRERVGAIPGATSLAFWGSDLNLGAPIDVSLGGRDREQLRSASEALKARLAVLPGVLAVRDSESEGKQELRISIRAEAEALGLSLAELARQVRQGFHGEEVQHVQRGRDDVAVVVRYPRAERSSLGGLAAIHIRLADGSELPFSSVAEARLAPGRSAIERRDRKSQIGVLADVDREVTSVDEVVTRLEAEILPEVLAAHPGVSHDFFGSSRDEAEMQAHLARGWTLALVAAYALLAVAMRSYLQPLVVFAAIPFGLVGGVAAHAALGIQFSGFSLVGLVALTGVVVNDALVLLDQANRLRAEGLGWAEALTEAGVTRFRAILLTSLTTFFGLLPLLFERSSQAAWLEPMAVTLGFGVLFATVITLLLVPAAALALEHLELRGRSSIGTFAPRETSSDSGTSPKFLPEV